MNRPKIFDLKKSFFTVNNVDLTKSNQEAYSKAAMDSIEAAPKQPYSVGLEPLKEEETYNVVDNRLDVSDQEEEEESQVYDGTYQQEQDDDIDVNHHLEKLFKETTFVEKEEEEEEIIDEGEFHPFKEDDSIDDEETRGGVFNMIEEIRQADGDVVGNALMEVFKQVERMLDSSTMRQAAVLSGSRILLTGDEREAFSEEARLQNENRSFENIDISGTFTASTFMQLIIELYKLGAFENSEKGSVDFLDVGCGIGRAVFAMSCIAEVRASIGYDIEVGEVQRALICKEQFKNEFQTQMDKVHIGLEPVNGSFKKTKNIDILYCFLGPSLVKEVFEEAVQTGSVRFFVYASAKGGRLHHPAFFSNHPSNIITWKSFTGRMMGGTCSRQINIGYIKPIFNRHTVVYSDHQDDPLFYAMYKHNAPEILKIENKKNKTMHLKKGTLDRMRDKKTKKKQEKQTEEEKQKNKKRKEDYGAKVEETKEYYLQLLEEEEVEIVSEEATKGNFLSKLTSDWGTKEEEYSSDEEERVIKELSNLLPRIQSKKPVDLTKDG